MTLSQILTHHQTVFSLFFYCISVVVVIPVFSLIHDRLDNHSLQFMWDKIGTPLLRTFLIIAFILLIYPFNFGIENAPAISVLLKVDKMRIDYLIDIIFILTFLFPLIPIIGKWDELIIPLQGIICSMMLFGWLCNAIQFNNYSLFPGFSIFIVIIIISIITYWIAEYLSHHIGEYLDKLFDREGFRLLVFRCVILIMQCPVIFIFGVALGKQITVLQLS